MDLRTFSHVGKGLRTRLFRMWVALPMPGSVYICIVSIVQASTPVYVVEISGNQQAYMQIISSFSRK